MPVVTELTFSWDDAAVLSVPAAMTRDHRLRGFNNRCSFLTVLKTKSPRSRCCQGWFLEKPLFLARRWLPSHCVLWVAFPLDTQKERDLVSLSFLIVIFPGGSEGKVSAWNAGDLGSIPESGRSPGEGNGNPLQ